MCCPALPELSSVEWRRSVTHLAPFAHSCPAKGGNGNAEAPLCWQVVPLSHLCFRKVESTRISQPHFQVLLTALKLAVSAPLPSRMGVGVTHCKKGAFLGPDL